LVRRGGDSKFCWRRLLTNEIQAFSALIADRHSAKATRSDDNVSASVEVRGAPLTRPETALLGIKLTPSPSATIAWIVLICFMVRCGEV
jgi:hypothetical protein